MPGHARRPTATAAPASIAARGLRARPRTATAGATSTASTSRLPEALDGHRQRRGQHEQQRQAHARGRAGPAAAAPAGSNATAVSGRCSATSAAPPSDGQDRGGGQVRVAHPERVAEQQLLEARGGVGRERQQPAEAEHARHHHGGGRVGADALVAAGERHERRRPPPRPRPAPSSSGAPGERGQHEPGQQAVRQRLGRVAEPVAARPRTRARRRSRRAGPPRRCARRSMPERHGSRMRSSSVHQCSWCWTAIARSGSPSSLEHHDLAAVGALEHLAAQHLARAARRPPGAG